MAKDPCAAGCEVPPRYTHTLIIEEPSGTADAAGQIDLTVDTNWSQVGRMRARFLTRGGREGYAFRQVQSNVSHIIECVSTSLTRSITTKMRLRMGSRKFNITECYDVDEGRKTVRIGAEEDVT